ncbi:MAG: hypothetical protein WAT78_06985 [Rhizobiaceae bacterium]
MKTVPEGIFKPKPNTSESRNDLATRIARELLQTETAARESKTARLRAARLEMERLAPPLVKAPAAKLKSAK